MRRCPTSSRSASGANDISYADVVTDCIKPHPDVSAGWDGWLPEIHIGDGDREYTVFEAFFAPVNNLPTVNTVKAGQAIPLKFRLGDDYGLDVLDDGYPLVRRVDCDSARRSTKSRRR